MIVVTGATGALGGAVVDQLCDSHSPETIAVAVRDPKKAQRFADRGIEVRRADYAEPASLPQAFEGADQLLLVSSSDPAADAVALHRAAIDAAVTAGVGRVLYTSHQGAHPSSPFAPARDHAATEWMLQESGLAWTALRNGFYAHSLEWLLGSWRTSGVVEVPGNGAVSWTAREDAAEAAASLIVSGSAPDGPVTLTAAAAPTFAEVAGIASDLTGAPVVWQNIHDDEWVAQRVASGDNEGAARFTLGIYQAAREGFFTGVAPTLREILGREPRTVREVLAASLR
ncbi:NAD(P)H-binding protein [Microbacterium sp. MPKO10]|uniref:NAD(P)H-binding protein n=1 Tax=Microbacterium sp. MPKO10 TaxID=2989818 RepID=UPI0022362700|nr:NAD(P)H-binding protein [Microbacterium sp. MPKO10]MCW4459999.1 NAD(P)H-binding protein [Microbacterium sp. MPKO10]